MSGVLLGMGKELKIPGAVLLAETAAEPTLLGVKGAQEVIKIIKDRFGFKVNLKLLSKEVKDVEKEIKEKVLKLEKQKTTEVKKKDEHVTYIG